MADDQKPKRTGAEGYGAGWAAVSYLIAGIGIWTFIGWLVARWLDIPVGIGVMVGMVWPSSRPWPRPHRRAAPGRASPYHLWLDRSGRRRAQEKARAGAGRLGWGSAWGSRRGRLSPRAVRVRFIRMNSSCSTSSHNGSESSTTYATSSSIAMFGPPMPAHLVRMSCQPHATGE